MCLLFWDFVGYYCKTDLRLLPRIDSKVSFLLLQTHTYGQKHTHIHTLIALLVVAVGQSEVPARSHCAGVFHSDTLALEGPVSLM